ncbi:MDR family oxidoreductase [Falsirhodobacter halotolerans]|uniref:MDR family oxidoreductase n=1 Tax=Falsirhodobacter halotolerans TaxID=1146892 RepID=UPI001FD00446|nr:MDR family oxidoreductase [Falsirhodobacter halotolerans]MCJ8138918.1 oxidoreductase [Falsirhodobacter halotolerans]
MFRALLVSDNGPPALHHLTEDDLPEGEVTVAVEWSSLNYKDGMVLAGRGGLVRRFPHVPGVDLAGRVTASQDDRFAVGDRVILTGWHVGERHWGGYAERARVKADWLVPCPKGLSLRDAMALGTAGFTAMQALVALEDRGMEAGAEVLVTGASGGVGSVAVALLADRYRVAAMTGRDGSYLRDLGAAEVVPRPSGDARPLDSARWGGAIDAVGGDGLAHVLAAMRPGAGVAAIGLAGGASAHLSLIPLLLRGVALLGIDSVTCPAPLRTRIWDRLANEMPRDKLQAMTYEIDLTDLPGHAAKILNGDVRGRTVVRVAR